MDEYSASEYAFKNGYREALNDAVKLELISIEVANKLLERHHIKPFSN